MRGNGLALQAAGDSALCAAGYRAARAYGGGAWNSLANRWRLKSLPMTKRKWNIVATVDPGVRLPAVKGRR